MEDLEAFGRLISALRPWLAQVVVVGGWAHRLHRFHPLANPAAHLPLRTRDADVAFPLDAELTGDIQAALRRAGFVQELFGDLVPPATHYRLGEEDAGFYAEFLTPLHGSGLKRRGAPRPPRHRSRRTRDHCGEVAGSHLGRWRQPAPS